MHWFTSDQHLGHFNIIRYTNRPFKNLEHMNKTIINRHNQMVKPEDTVFILGDFCFKNSQNRGEGEPLKSDFYLQQLNGHIIRLRGNHDNNNSAKTPIKSMVITVEGKEVFMTHRPEDANESGYELNFVGHVHEAWKFNFNDGEEGINRGTLINVGVDVWGFYPVNMKTITKAYRKWMQNRR